MCVYTYIYMHVFFNVYVSVVALPAHHQYWLKRCCCLWWVLIKLKRCCCLCMYERTYILIKDMSTHQRQQQRCTLIHIYMYERIYVWAYIYTNKCMCVAMCARVLVYLWIFVTVWWRSELTANIDWDVAAVCGMGWLRLVGSSKLYVSFAEYSLFYRTLLQKRPMLLNSLLVVATPWALLNVWMCVYIKMLLHCARVCCSVCGVYVAVCCSCL